MHLSGSILDLPFVRSRLTASFPAHLHARVGKAALAAVCHIDPLFRTRIAGEFDHIDERRRVYVSGLSASSIPWDTGAGPMPRGTGVP